MKQQRQRGKKTIISNCMERHQTRRASHSGQERLFITSMPPDRANRPDQQTFCCVVCGLQTHADLNAATNIARRAGDLVLQACKDRKAVKSLLMQRHEARGKQHGWP